MQADIVVCS
jgi:next-to-BRCA1 protein 1